MNYAVVRYVIGYVLFFEAAFMVRLVFRDLRPALCPAWLYPYS